MQLWKLAVIQPNSDDWHASTYKGKVIIRASDEDSARQLATIAFAIATTRVVGQTTPINPWCQKGLVSCEPFESNEYDMDSSEAILYPSQ